MTSGAAIVSDLSPARIEALCADQLGDGAVHLRVLAEVDSTNSEVARWRRTLGAASAVIAVVADRQNAGRGRRGRTWRTAPGSAIHLSLARRMGAGHSVAPLGLACALAVCDALAGLGARGVAIKWPNDIVCDASGERAFAKLGGLLLEASASGHKADGSHEVIVGVGMNVSLPPSLRAALEDQTDYAVADFAAIGLAERRRSDVAAALIVALARALERFQLQGFAPFVSAWDRVDLLRGRQVDVLGPDGVRRQGVASGIAADGALRVSVTDQTQPLMVHAGEVSVRPR